MEYKKNDRVTVEITDIGSQGEGIGRAEGFLLFVKDAVPGDLVEAKIVKCKKNYAYARVEKVVKPSPFRVTPKCPVYRQCGGCQLQAFSYEKQLEYKLQKIRGHLIHIGGFDPEWIDAHIEPMVGMEEPYRYRNKAQYPVGTDKEGGLVTGFYAGRTHDIIPNTDCLLGVPENERILHIILDYMRKNGVSAYDEVSGQGLVRHILIRKGFTSGEIMVCLVLNGKLSDSHRLRAESGKDGKGKLLSHYDFLPNQGELIRDLCGVNGMTSISVNINTRRDNVIMGREVYTIWGSPGISDVIHVRDMSKKGFPVTGQKLTFKISPLSFYQVNPVQTEKLYSTALEYAGLTGKETVWDLYCGIGTISLFLAAGAKKVCGVEIVPQAIEDARENAVRNHVENVEFFVGKAEEVLPRYYESGNREEGMLHPDVIVVDPPRKGCDAACLSTMLKMRPERIVYVSCDSATLARDLKILCGGGYEIGRIRGFDQFAQGVHVETVCQLVRRGGNPDAAEKKSN